MKTVVFRYGCLAPTALAEKVDEQIRLAHQYQNKLVELEQSRRKGRDAVLAVVPNIAVLDSKLAAFEAELETERSALSRGRSEARDRKVGDPTRAQNIRAEMELLWKERKAALKEALALPAIQASLAEVAAKHKVEVKAARAACGVYWGTYLPIEAAADQSSKAPTPPRFQRWTGDGAVSVQFQGGLTVSAMQQGDDTRIRISPIATPVPERGGKPLPRLLLRVGSEGRAPIFAEWPIILHRPLPEGKLSGVKVVRRRIGAHYQWSAHFTVTTESAPEATGLPLAVNLRWSKSVQGGETTTLAADWRDEAGGGEVHVDPAVVSQLKKSDDLRSIRDKNFEIAKGQLAAALKLVTLPEELKLKLEHLHAWKAQGKLAAVVVWWRTNRFAGDMDAFMHAEAWRKQDKHLWDWEANARGKALARRKDDYRVFAARMVRAHKTLVVEKLNIARLAKTPEPEEDRDVNAKASAQRFATSPSELRTVLVNAFRREGGLVVEVQAGLTSKEMLALFHSTGGVAVAKPVQRSARTTRLLKNKGKPAVPVDQAPQP